MTSKTWKYTDVVDDTLELALLPGGANLLHVNLYDNGMDRECEIVLPPEKAVGLRDWLLEHYPLVAPVREGVSVLDFGQE